MPYPAEAFDASICALAIHYVADRPAAFAEFYRVLRAGAALRGVNRAPHDRLAPHGRLLLRLGAPNRHVAPSDRRRTGALLA
ncbi:MAG: methyltransferase domain-containing protein [Pseudonocardiales bacterium]|nr:methyltransferase domain-containing protein [Pseudonocardiales bacterium]